MQCMIDLGKENIFLLIFNDGMMGAKQINIFGIFNKRVWWKWSALGNEFWMAIIGF